MSEKTRLFFIRHGDTIDEETKKVFKGTLDVPLSERGRSRIEGAAVFLSRFHIDHIYTSALSRCVESGSIIARPRALEIRISAAFNELHFGAWEGLSFNEIAQQYPEQFRLWFSDPEGHTPPEGEPLGDMQKRVLAGFYEIVDRHRGQNIAVVAHGGVVRVIVCALLDIRLSALSRISQDYGGITIIDVYEDNNPVIKLLNFTYYS